MSLLYEILSGRRPPDDIKVLVQGMTGRYGSTHSELMMKYGTNIVAGVTPGKGGQEVLGVPIYNTVKEAKEERGVEASIIFVPAPFYYSAIHEALENGIRLVVGITERVPVRDTLKLLKEAKEKGANIIGPNTPGIIVPPRFKMGIMPTQPFKKGSIVVFSRSGTLTYEISNYLSKDGLGIYVAIGIGGDPINSTNFIELMEMVKDNPEVKGVVVIGEIGGEAEERVASYIVETDYPKPVVSYVAGRSAPKEKRMGHAGAIIYGNYGTVESKEAAFAEAGVPVAKLPFEVPKLMREKLER
jgi:succinyl-CoA synthetase alpha subunit